MVTLTSHACTKYKVHKLQQRCILKDVYEDVNTRMPGKSYRRRLRSLLLYLCYVFPALINSFVCWFCTSARGLVLFQIAKIIFACVLTDLGVEAEVAVLRCQKVLFFSNGILTPSLPQAVKFPGWKIHRCACKQCIFRSCNISFQCCAFWWKPFHLPVQNRKPKGWRVSNFAILWVVFKWLHGSERGYGHSVCRSSINMPWKPHNIFNNCKWCLSPKA